jgi:hypothetical protein
MTLERSNATPHSIQHTKGVAAVWELKENITYGTVQAHWTYVWASDRAFVRSAVLQQEEFRSLITAIIIVKTLPI